VVAVLGLFAVWWTRSDSARRSATRAAASGETPVAPRAAASDAAVEARRAGPVEPRASSAAPPFVAVATAASASAAPAGDGSARAASAEASDTPPEEPLGEAEGWLRVRGQRFSIYLNGGLAGVTGQWIRTACGVRHLRLAHVDPPPRGRSFPWWVDEGGPVIVPCGASSTVDVDPGGRR
jgi:hypothetical protein